MSLLARAFPAAADRPPQRTNAGGYATSGGITPGGVSGSGGAPTAVSTAQIIIHFIARRLGALPRVVYDLDDYTRRPMRTDEFAYLWGRPNRAEYGIHFWTRAFALLEGWSECFLWRRTIGDMTVGLDIIHPSDVEVDVDSSGAREFTLYGDEKRRYSDDQIFHIMALTWDGKRAVPPVRAGLAAHQIAALQDRWQRSFLRKGSAPSGVVTTPGEYDDEALIEFYEAWREQHGGAEGVGNVILLQGGAKFQPVTIPPAEAQLLQSRQFSREEILGFYAPGLPHHLLGWRSNTSNFGTGVEMQGIHLVQHVFELRLDLVADVIGAAFLPDGVGFGWDVGKWLRGDAKSQAEVRAKDRMGGFITRNEGRREVDLPASGLPDDFWVPKNVTSVPADGSAAANPDD